MVIGQIGQHGAPAATLVEEAFNLETEHVRTRYLSLGEMNVLVMSPKMICVMCTIVQVNTYDSFVWLIKKSLYLPEA